MPRAVEALWPDRQVVLGPRCPSVTSYVRRVTVDDEELIAKYGRLGMSLMSILRGAGADRGGDVRSVARPRCGAWIGRAPVRNTDPGSIGRDRAERAGAGKDEVLPRGPARFRGSAADGNPEPNPVSLDERARNRGLLPVV
ncbi:hypothetical protein ACIOEX_30470 [Streptomyces sp. NPDC087850]|uniref:hypothetical protein n=1 Tax=Streptomyces sp. NPDC087850 TaxID=3365809 RepID=UPI003821B897